MKHCTKCKFTKALTEFNKKSGSKDGFSSYCKTCNQAYLKSWNSINKEQKKLNRIKWDSDNREYLREKKRKYKEANQLKINKLERERKKTDLQFRLACSLRVRFAKALKKNSKGGSAVLDLGCSIEELKTYLESKFQPGMSWDNYGLNGWHIDHIRPLVSFDLTDKDQVKEACKYTNLQPLWAEDNLSKGDTYAPSVS